jgi:electron transport complex protein RnfE
MENNGVKKIALDGLLYKNPILVQLLGICSTLAVTTSVINGIAMGLCTTAVLVFSNLFISLLRKFISKEVRIASYIVVISGFVTAIELLLKAFLPDISKSLGVFIPLIVVNCIILSRAESFASKNGPVSSILDGLFMGLGFTAALICVSSIREIIGAGTFLGLKITPEAYQPVQIFIGSAGAFFTLAIVVAAVNKVLSSIEKKHKKEEK